MFCYDYSYCIGDVCDYRPWCLRLLDNRLHCCLAMQQGDAAWAAISVTILLSEASTPSWHSASAGMPFSSSTTRSYNHGPSRVSGRRPDPIVCVPYGRWFKQPSHLEYHERTDKHRLKFGLPVLTDDEKPSRCDLCEINFR